MKSKTFKVVGALSLAVVTAVLPGCGAGDNGESSDQVQWDDDSPEMLGTLDQPLCENTDGINSVMTALAVAAGRELGRWLPERDFQWNSSKGMLELSEHAAPRCRGMAPSKACSNLQALLDLQKPEANGKVKFPGNIVLDSNKLKSTLKANWSAQTSCNASSSCNITNHDLRYTHQEDGSCDEKYFFNPFVMGTNTRLSAAETDKLKNKLRFLGYPANKMLNFYLRDGQVSVDPTYGLNEGGSTMVGSCEAACTKFSTASVAGKCCSCNGVNKKYVRATWNASTFLCQ